MAKTSKEIKALERLTSKLSALRKTLRGDERKQLDAMVLGGKSEVALHAAGVKVSPAQADAKSEVALHAANVRGAQADGKNMAKAEGKTLGKTLAKSEVALHAANVRGAQADGKAMAKAEGKTARITMNAKSGVYEVVVD